MMWSNRAVSRWLLTASVALGLALPLGSALAGSYTLQGNELKLPGPVQFETASDKLRPENFGPLRPAGLAPAAGGG